MKKIKIVFLHGLAGSWRNFEYLKKEFPDYQTISFDLAQGLENIHDSVAKKIDHQKTEILSLIGDFQKHLEQEKASKNTIKNYVADVKHFLTWIEINHA